MAASGDQTVMRRKLNAAAALALDGGPGADRSWRVALARAARDAMGLGLEVRKLQAGRASLAELLEQPAELAFVAILEGPGDGLGLLLVQAPVLAAMTEMLTIGRVSVQQPGPRKPTLTDAAMVADFVDLALRGLEEALAEEADLVWAGGFRYGSFLDDPRPLGLLLEDISYRVLKADVSLAEGIRSGQILLALPAEGRGQRPRTTKVAHPEVVAGHMFSAALTEQVHAAKCEINAVLDRVSVPLSRVISLQVGDEIVLPKAHLDRIIFEGLDGGRLGDGRLGQNRGMRAVRVNGAAPVAAAPQVQGDLIDLKRVAG